jgi:leucyl-tRNA synthetase
MTVLIAGWTIRHSNWTTSEDTTSVNIDGFDKEGNKIAGYRKQLDKIGFSFGAESENFKSGLLQAYPMDFIQLFNSWYNKDNDKAEDVSTLISIFEKREMQL